MIQPDDSRFRLGLRYSLISLLFGWWGIPWGPIWTLGTVFKNLGGGVDVTANVLSALNAAAPIPQAPGVQRAA